MRRSQYTCVAVIILFFALPAFAQTNDLTGKGDHFFNGKCCYCLEADQHKISRGKHYFLVQGQWRAVRPKQVRLTPDPAGQKMYYCSGTMVFMGNIPEDRCGLIPGTS